MAHGNHDPSFALGTVHGAKSETHDVFAHWAILVDLAFGKTQRLRPARQWISCVKSKNIDLNRTATLTELRRGIVKRYARMFKQLVDLGLCNR